MAAIKGEFTKYNGEITVRYNITDAMKDKIIARLLKYYQKHHHDGEGIHQDDDSIIEAPSVMSDIADDIIKFEVIDTAGE